jgi:hypothetical protein
MGSNECTTQIKDFPSRSSNELQASSSLVGALKVICHAGGAKFSSDGSDSELA